ncbi:Acyl-CoA dehydrogenase apdG [Fulvia fulva]|uniref:Acyl-CoA dehydrogenase apdG n=1 Tax=Passalora fulva TaxID=5499 RepID=A0A9Q8LFS0_PASFU|nr:Acyl-CoA dehydrogenase apdG [Fulvia fulva]UJO16389.1 Acyl-CoA dehydrogenase apdG [Fulvia fulva]WPV29068.1 Acyl-CoA dehydrogenase apdG [Fulvia fulva]
MAAQDDPLTQTPFSEPAWLAGFPSPLYRDTHKRFQISCRAWFEKHFLPYCMDWENEGDLPSDLFAKFNQVNMLLPNLCPPLPVDWLHKSGIKDILGTPVEEWDYVHTAIWVDEIHRSGLAGPSSGLTAGFAYGIPPIIKYGSRELQERFLPDLLTGRKRTCIAITEPTGGSDVANVETSAVKSKDGKHYVVNGQKKWITNAIWADYTTMTVRTGGKGPGGLSLLVVPLKVEGVEMRRLKCTGSKTGGTTFIELEDVKVPVENLIERLMIALGATRQSRVALSTAMGYVMKREAFGKPLAEQPVVRHRLAKAGAQLEMLQAWLDQFLWQMLHLPKSQADKRLGGLTALVKATAGMVLNEGNGFTQTGQGELVEKIYRDVFGSRIPGGSEDVMLDLAVRQLIKNYQRATKELEKSGGNKSKL